MKWFLFPVAVLATSVALVAALAAFVIPPAGIALASTLGLGSPSSATAWQGGPWHGGAWGNGATGFTMPSQLQGLAGIPADQRFGHFVGIQMSLKDKDNNPVTVDVTAGTVSTASASSLTVTANDGTTKTYALNDKTMIHRASTGSTPTSDAASAPTLATGDNVVVVTLDKSTTAMAVVDGGPRGFNWSGPGASH